VVECTMFYVLIFSLAAVVLVIAFFSARTRRRRTMAGEDVLVSSPSHPPHGTQPDAAVRRQRKAKRSQSQHDRRKRH
jgi:hypothetical protein